MTDSRHIDGHYYPPFHNGWGGFAEELFHYTSRYFFATEAFLRNLVDDRDFTMVGYKANRLNELQRELMAWQLADSPERQRGLAIVSIVETVKIGGSQVDEVLLAACRARAPKPDGDGVVQRVHGGTGRRDGHESLDFFLNLAERLQMPVAVKDHHVEVALQELARHLDCGNAALRSNLQEAVLRLHEAGFVLRNHPHLTHSEAHVIADGDSV